MHVIVAHCPLQQSLMSTIINLAQNFIGSNNINLLQPRGQFGTRLHGGKDAASPRSLDNIVCDATHIVCIYIWNTSHSMPSHLSLPSLFLPPTPPLCIRYIFTLLSPLARLLFPINDDPQLRFLKEDNLKLVIHL